MRSNSGFDSFSTRFIIDRFEWNIGIKAGWLAKRLVDKEVELTIDLALQHSASLKYPLTGWAMEKVAG